MRFGCHEVLAAHSTSSATFVFATLSSLKELESRNEKELLQEDLRIEDSNVGGSTDKGVGCVRQGMNDIVSH